MWDAECAVSALRARGELWEVAPGRVGLRGDALELLHTIEGEIDIVAGAEDADVLVPAAGFHCYAPHAGTTIARRVAISARRGYCARQGDDRLSPLEPGWAFTMREIVVLGAREQTSIFLRRSRAATIRFARSLGLDVRVAEAEDSFFAPIAGGRRRVGRARGLESELLAPIAIGRELAIASFDDHERYFGETFDISLATGGPASSGSVSFALERWLLAVLVAGGPDARDWPALPAPARAVAASDGAFVAAGGLARC
jgi:hypothetical protein